MQSTNTSLVSYDTLAQGDIVNIDGVEGSLGVVTSTGNLDGANNASITSAVPIMTSDTAPSGVAISSGVFAGYYSFKAFDNLVDAIGWVVNNNSVYPQYVGYDFGVGNEKVINKAIIVNRAEGVNVNRSINTYEFQASNDGSSWVTLSNVFTNTNDASGYQHPACTWLNIVPYRFYRLYITNGLDGTYVGVGELSFIEETNPNKYTADITSFNLTTPPKYAYIKDGEVLTKVSSTLTEFVGTNAISGLLTTGDSIQVDGTTDVVCSNVVESGTGPYTYTCTIPTQATAPTSAKVLDRSITTTEASDVYNSGTNNFTKTYNTIPKQGRAFKYKITADTGAQVDKINIPMHKL